MPPPHSSLPLRWIAVQGLSRSPPSRASGNPRTGPKRRDVDARYKPGHDGIAGSGKGDSRGLPISTTRSARPCGITVTLAYQHFRLRMLGGRRAGKTPCGSAPRPISDAVAAECDRLFEERPTRSVADRENLDRLDIHAVEKPKREIDERDHAHPRSLGDLGRAVRELQQPFLDR